MKVIFSSSERNRMYPTLVTFHVIFAGMWLSFFIIESILRNKIEKSDNINKVSDYLNFSNSFGIIGSVGILITGIVIVMMNNQYGFFDMSSNHWLATKQIILLVILIMTGSLVIPNSKKIRAKLESQELDINDKGLKKLFRANQIINYLVLINLIFAITHRFYG